MDISPFAVLGGIRSACRRVQSLINELTEYDEVLGDGDCGDTFYKGAEGMWQTNGRLSYSSLP